MCGFSAVEGGETLSPIIETDAGSHRLGEAALGMNPGLTRALKERFYVEKVGGTAHIALGQSLRGVLPDMEAAKKDGTFNDSARHVDLVVDFRWWRRHGALAGRDLLMVKDGIWTVDKSRYKLAQTPRHSRLTTIRFAPSTPNNGGDRGSGLP